MQSRDDTNVRWKWKLPPGQGPLIAALRGSSLEIGAPNQERSAPQACDVRLLKGHLHEYLGQDEAHHGISLDLSQWGRENACHEYGQIDD
jgi:hypothetical protein